MNDVTYIRRRAVMTRAMLSAASRLGLTREQLAAATGLGLGEITALTRDELHLDPDDPRWHDCVQLVRLYRAVEALKASDPGEIKAWMRGYCRDLRAVPAQMIGEPGGLESAIAHLEPVVDVGAKPLTTANCRANG
jgi:hypothetical protein